MLFNIYFLIIFHFLKDCLSQDYHVLDFGAKGDGITDDTEAVRATMAAANNSHGGRVIFDKGYTFLTGSFIFSNNTILDIRGKVLGADNSDHFQWPTNSSNNQWTPLIGSFYTSNITITGGGVIDGQGYAWWSCSYNLSVPPCSNKTPPFLIFLHNTVDITVYNITLQNSPFYNLHIDNGTNIHVYNIQVLNPPSFGAFNGSHNTDAVNIIGVQNVLVENSYISTGDDSIAIYSWCDGPPSKNILIRNLTIGTSHGISVGSVTCGGISNVTFENIMINGTACGEDYTDCSVGIHVKSARDRGNLVQNITYRNIQITGVHICIYLNMNYTKAYIPPNNKTTPYFRNINIHDVYCNNSKFAYAIDGLPESEIDAHFRNIRVENFSYLNRECANVYGSCDNSTVLPQCPPCMATKICENTSNDCNSYLNQCNNPQYHSLLCNLCKNTCKLCDSCN